MAEQWTGILIINDAQEIDVTIDDLAIPNWAATLTGAARPDPAIAPASEYDVVLKDASGRRARARDGNDDEKADGIYFVGLSAFGTSRMG
jgi:hypothetical protein